ncbi:MAG: N-acetylglucosamine-6-sulfatase [Solirubrobacteraceae bacterium]|jgi:arylsulfatase A-like enzyme|nr:N-acetylglucosamine-6-sulfatase [Solirubrobacteraceae bacterium]
MRTIKRTGVTAAAVASLLLPVAAQARPVSAASDGRPNVLVVMTDDMAASDLAKMPNVQRLLVDKGTTMTNAVDSFPLCCPSRATFITGQYAHNHGVIGNFWPYGWYGMKDRRNILPAWLDDAGYDTSLIGKWLNGYGARDAHGEIPAGFDHWRGLLDVSAYDYFNFVMNIDGKLRTWGDSDFARKLVKFANIEVTPNPDGVAGIVRKLQELFGPAPYHYWGTEVRSDYSPDVTGRVAEGLVRAGAHARKPFFVWWAPAAPHREDVATTLMGRPGRDPRPAPRYAKSSARYKLPEGASFNEADISDKPSNMTAHATVLSDANLKQLQLDYEGRMGSLQAVDDHVATLVRTLRKTHQLANTTIIFVSDNGWLQGQHRIPGDKFLPYEESIKVPLVIRGPGIPAGRTVSAQVSNIDFAPTLLDLAGATADRVQDGHSLLPLLRGKTDRGDRIVELEAPAPLFEQDVPINAWDRPYKGVRTDRYTYVRYTETGEEELYDRDKDPAELNNLAANPAYAAFKTRLADQLAQLDTCSGASCRTVTGVRRTNHAVNMTGTTATVAEPYALPGAVHDRGTVTGTPFGNGTIDLIGKLADGRLTGTFRLDFPNGSVLGRVDARYTISGGTIDFTGTARVTGGTGTYREITSGALDLTDHNTLDGQHGTLTVTGSVRY